MTFQNARIYLKAKKQEGIGREQKDGEQKGLRGQPTAPGGRAGHILVSPVGLRAPKVCCLSRQSAGNAVPISSAHSSNSAHRGETRLGHRRRFVPFEAALPAGRRETEQVASTTLWGKHPQPHAGSCAAASNAAASRHLQPCRAARNTEKAASGHLGNVGML